MSQVTAEALEVSKPFHWERISIQDDEKIRAMSKRLNIDIRRSIEKNVTHDGQYMLFPLTFLSVEQEQRKISRAVFILGDNRLITIEPESCPLVIENAMERMKQSYASCAAEESFAVALQAINDATDELIDTMNKDLGKVLVQTNAVLNSLETRDRDFGVSDVVATQVNLGEVEELLSDCLESQLQLAVAARHIMARIPATQTALKALFLTLVEDIEAVEERVSFVHERVRLLQTTNNMALNVKQNQIVKVFSVVTAVFLPAMLISTFYSMNIGYMPILEWQYGEPMVIFLTVLFSLLPLLYVKHRGWLR
ncbi:Magnesium transport protein CorA [Oligella sp. MSHR50489EDL]|uniref:CorA family divalent cation transporter n=1 Tax=Oligella sp. MSHR50489EDL TaxID=3139409 RepID=UPI003D815FE6